MPRDNYVIRYTGFQCKIRHPRMMMFIDTEVIQLRFPGYVSSIVTRIMIMDHQGLNFIEAKIAYPISLVISLKKPSDFMRFQFLE